MPNNAKSDLGIHRGYPLPPGHKKTLGLYGLRSPDQMPNCGLNVSATSKLTAMTHFIIPWLSVLHNLPTMHAMQVALARLDSS